MKLMLDPKTKRDHKSVKVGTTRILVKPGEPFDIPSEQEAYTLLGEDKEIVQYKSRSGSQTKDVKPAQEDKVEAVIKESK